MKAQRKRRVPNAIAATVERLLAAGGTLVRALAPSRFGMRAVVRDREGHAVEIRQR